MEAVVILHPGKDKSLLRRHPWVFSGAIREMKGEPKEGDLVSVLNHRGKILATGMYGSGSIAVRVLDFSDVLIDESFWIQRLSHAWELRKTLGLAENQQTNIFRWVHGEGDGLPGLIIDVYGEVAVLQPHQTGMYRHRESIACAMMSVAGAHIKAVYCKGAEAHNPNETSTSGYIIGQPTCPAMGLEYGHHFKIDWERGQKTGFFVDQRENRRLLGSLAKDKKVLNTFSYSGGFSVYALQGGAKLVHSVDSSALAIEWCDENVALIDKPIGKHESFKADVLQHIKELPEDYDIIVLDPPAFAKNLKARHRAVQAYKRLNAAAMRQIKPGGLIFTFSCSQVVDKSLFHGSVLAAAIESDRKVRVLHQLHQPADHPINMFHPEGEYLKGLVIQVE
ncbi:MAG: class I SAM-dependent rRNA methyltransferase [Cryomorphaceae bacterium]|nr:MAG: class I SAM-dependent rRNA methyltransferase [Cryomorphaceae bacterium]